jgi:hypothetical protein
LAFEIIQHLSASINFETEKMLKQTKTFIYHRKRMLDCHACLSDFTAFQKFAESLPIFDGREFVAPGSICYRVHLQTLDVH